MRTVTKLLPLGLAAIGLPLAVATIGGCLTAKPEAGLNALLYHRNWWNYYEHGAALLATGQVATAREDFERCLGLRAGARYAYDRDEWRSRTYGLHIIEDYFPNRELGVCLYLLNDPNGAIRCLDRSLRLTPSGRAKHYLNLARTASLRGQTVPAPAIRIDRAAAAVLTRERTRVLSGEATAAGHVRGLRIRGEPLFIELAEPRFAFARPVPLKEGSNAVPVEAEDLLGQRTATVLHWVADWRPPCLVLRRLFRQNGDWRIEGVCRDDRGLASLRIDGEEQPIPSSGAVAVAEIPFAARVPAAGAYVQAVDAAGNRLERRLDAAELLPPDAAARAGTLLAGRFDAAEALALAGPSLAPEAPVAPGTDRLRPSLTVRDVRPVTVVFASEFFLDGTAADNGGLQSVSVSGEELLVPADRGAVRAYFARRLPLDPGTNRFEIVATDVAGNRSTQPLTVVRRQPEFLDDAYRLGVGVPPLLPAETVPLATRVKRGIETELVRTPIRFRLLERDEGWEFVLREQGLSLSDLADPRAALRIGKLVPADLLFMGRLFPEGTGLTVYVKVVDTASGEVRMVSDIYSPSPERTVEDDVAGLVMKIAQGFPLLTGEIIRRQGALATLNVGSDQGGLAGARFMVVRAAPGADPAAGALCRVEGTPVQLSMERVRRDSAVARIIPAEGSDAVQEGDHVYAR
jgi:hypothetical protein